jgi:threonine dehydratase
VNFERLGHVSERADLGERREAVLAVSIPERPGSFRAFCLALGAREITECNYRRGDGDEAHVFCGVRVEHAGEVAELARELRAQGYGVLDLTDDEIAKVHVRHLVGGRARHVADERLYAFLFPERRGALAEFLAAMRHPWSISLFHYRNHGSDFGRVLVGLEVPDAELAELDAFVARVGFEGECVTGDPACGLFLR